MRQVARTRSKWMAVLAIVGLRRTPREGTERSTIGRVVAILSLVVLAAYLVAAWAMSAKPD